MLHISDCLLAAGDYSYPSDCTLVLNMYCKGYVKYIKLYFSVLADGSADPDKMPQYAAFHLGLHCFNLFTE